MTIEELETKTEDLRKRVYSMKRQYDPQMEGADGFLTELRSLEAEWMAVEDDLLEAILDEDLGEV
jgi:hypothetical protein